MSEHEQLRDLLAEALECKPSQVEGVLTQRELTLGFYSGGIRKLALFLGATPVQAVRYVVQSGPSTAKRTASDYRDHMRSLGSSASTINLGMSVIGFILKTADSLRVIDWTVLIKREPEDPVQDVAGPSREAVIGMFERMRTRRDDKGLRDYALARLVYDLALRRAEVQMVDVEDFDPDTGILMATCKGRDGKFPAALPALTRQALEDWVDRRGREVPGPMFISFDPAIRKRNEYRRISTRSVTRMLDKAGLGESCTPNRLRHASITRAIDLADGHYEVKDFARHQSAQTARRYDDKLQERPNRGGDVAEKLSKDSTNEEAD